MARTGSSAYVQYEYESTFQTAPTFVKAFGCEQKVTGLRFINNMIPIKELNTPEIKAFAYGKNEGGCSLEFILSNPWFFDFIFANPETVGVSAPYTHQWSSDPLWVGSGAFDNTDVKDYTTASLDFGFAGETANEHRTALGAIAPSLSLRTTINETVKVTMPLIWGKEEAIDTTLDSSVAPDDLQFPYTFVHATLELPDGTPIAQIQDFEITMSPEGELIWGVGSANASATSGKKIINITGKFKKAKVDATALQQVVDRTEVATLEIVLTNGIVGAGQKSISILGTGVGISEHTNDYVPGEIVFEDLTWQIRSLLVTATNGESSPP